MPFKRSARCWIDSDDSAAAQGLVALVVNVGPCLSRDTCKACRTDFGRSDRQITATGTARACVAEVYGRSASIISRPHGPFGVMALLDEVKGRFVSRGGRPADSAPTIRRLVPLRKQVWRELQAQANRLSTLGRHVSPGQLAAMLLERSLSDLGTQGGDSATRSDAESVEKL